jgi:hypothetical protein
MLHDVRADIQETSLVSNGDGRTLCPIVLRDLKGLCEGSQRFDISLHTHVPEHEQSWTDGALSEAPSRLQQKKRSSSDVAIGEDPTFVHDTTGSYVWVGRQPSCSQIGRPSRQIITHKHVRVLSSPIERIQWLVSHVEAFDAFIAIRDNLMKTHT